MTDAEENLELQMKERKFPKRGTRKLSLDMGQKSPSPTTIPLQSNLFEHKEMDPLTSPRRTKKHLEHSHPLHVTKSYSPNHLKYEKPLPETPKDPLLSARERNSIFKLEERKEQRKNDLYLSKETSFEDVFDQILEQITSTISLKNIKSQFYMEEVTKTTQSVLLTMKINHYSKYKVLVKGVKIMASEEETTNTILTLAKSNDEFLKKTLKNTRKEEKYIIHKVQVYFFKLHSRLKRKKSILDSDIDLFIERSDTKDEEEIPRDYNGYKLNFMGALQNPEIRKGFTKHLQLESNLDPFDFITHVQKLKKEGQKWSDFEFIINNFIKKGSEKEINISGHTRSEIIKKYDSGVDENPFKILEPAYNEIYRDLKDDVWTRYISTLHGYNIICKYSNDPTIISKDVR